jgi:hypothetical protein
VINRSMPSGNFLPLKGGGRCVVSSAKDASGGGLSISVRSTVGPEGPGKFPQARLLSSPSAHDWQNEGREYLFRIGISCEQRRGLERSRLHAELHRVQRQASQPCSRNRERTARPGAGAETRTPPAVRHGDETRACILPTWLVVARIAHDLFSCACGQNETPSEPHSSRQPNKNFPPLKRESRIGPSETKGDPGRDHRTIDIRMTPTRAAARLDLPLLGGGKSPPKSSP